ncbi:MAG: hypothetical protein PHE53_05130 [Thermoguttaceae bacterium]|nr:hypothetical protein [Thermoguttaceae bacterium]
MNQKHGKTTQVEYHGRTFEYTPQFTTTYPGNPNCPETWQGWKELEESLTPSTMRDEIRMTRIVIQYCDTEDSKVLDELTEWLQNMSEIQRVVMVQNVMNLPNNFPQDGEVRKPLLQLIETIKPFAAPPLPDWKVSMQEKMEKTAVAAPESENADKSPESEAAEPAAAEFAE